MLVIIILGLAAILPGTLWYTLKHKTGYSDVALSLLAVMMVFVIVICGAWLNGLFSGGECTDCIEGDNFGLALYTIPIYGAYLLAFIYSLISFSIHKLKNKRP